MFCKKCGKKIKEGNNFCTKCGTPVNEIIKNKEISEDKTEMKKDNKKIAIKIIPPIIVIIIIAIIVFLVFKMNKDENIESNVNNEISVEEKDPTNSESENITVEEITSENLLDEIYAKYPKLKDTEGIICTDGESYWLLDENGEKVYFDSMESFEKAKEECNLDVELLENNEDVETNEETTTSTEPQESLSETGSTGSQNNNYNSQDNNNNYLDEMPSQWSADVEINSTDACFNYNGQKCYVKNFGNDIANANYFCYLQDPSTLSNYDLDKTMSKGKGVKYYINGNYIGDSSSKSFNYTFNKNQSVTVKVVASYIFDFATRKTIATNATVYEKTDTAENFYKKSHGTTVSISLPSIWD